MKDLAASIAAVVAGDMACFPDIRAVDHQVLLDASKTLPQLSVSRSSLKRILTDWSDGRLSADDASQWAIFVRHGYIGRWVVVPLTASGCNEVPRAARGIAPIDIEYDIDDEDLIVMIVNRLDEIGDRIDGVVDDEERREMLRALQD